MSQANHTVGCIYLQFILYITGIWLESLKDCQFTFDFQMLTLQKQKLALQSSQLKPLLLLSFLWEGEVQGSASSRARKALAQDTSSKVASVPSRSARYSPYLPDDSHPDSLYCICTNQIMLHIITVDFLFSRKPAGGQKRQMGKSWVKVCSFLRLLLINVINISNPFINSNPFIRFSND